MRIYLDMCCLQRPMDDQSAFRVRMETEAVLGILRWCRSGNGDLINSVALKYEHDHHSKPIRKAFSHEILGNAISFVGMSDVVEQAARAYRNQGLQALDALHLACAVHGQADFFCTCDDRFLRRAKIIDTGITRVVSPLELFEEIES